MTFIAEAQLAACSHTLSAHAVLISFRKCSDSKAAEDGASLVSEHPTPEFEDVGTERGREKCCFSLSSGCHLIREECRGSSGSSRAVVVQAAPDLQQHTHSDVAGFSFSFFFPSSGACVHKRDTRWREGEGERTALVRDEGGGKYGRKMRRWQVRVKVKAKVKDECNMRWMEG